MALKKQNTRVLLCPAVLSVLPPPKRGGGANGAWHHRGGKPVCALRCLSLPPPAGPCDAGVCPSALWKPQNKRSPGSASSGCWALAEGRAPGGGSLRFPYMGAQPDPSSCGIKSQKPGCRSETSGAESPDPQEHSPPWPLLNAHQFLLFFFSICPQMPGLSYHYYCAN